MANLHSSGKDDPFEWDVDRLVKELCTQMRTWESTPLMQFPDPLELEARLRENEYNGEMLLTAPESDLWSDLGIGKTKLKYPIRTAIRQFQKRSPAYRKYNKSLYDSSDDDKVIKERSKFLSPSLTDAPTPNSAPFDGSTSKQANGLDSIQIPTHATNEAASNALEKAMEKAMEKENVAASAHPEDKDSIEQQHKHKKRKLSMTGLVALDPACTVQYQAKFSNPTEADMFLPRLPKLSSDLLKSLESGPTAYWGNGSLHEQDPAGVGSVTDSDVEFAFTRSIHIGPGRIQWLNGKLKKFMRNTTYHSLVDEVLPVFGESDDEDNSEWSDIAREREDEEEDIRREKLVVVSEAMSPAAVNTCIEEMVKKLIAQWQDSKLPRQQRKAYKIWTQTGSRQMRHAEAIGLRQCLKQKTLRLDQQIQALKDNSYACKKELEDLESSLEPTVFEIETLKWTVSLLLSMRAPDRVSMPPAPRRKHIPAAPADGGIDIWSESDEDDLDDFIEDDDGPVSRAAGYNPLSPAVDAALPALGNSAGARLEFDASPNIPVSQSFGSSTDGDVVMYDLTNIEDTGDAIDLLSRPEAKSKPARRKSPLPSPPFSDIKAIGSKSGGFWLKNGDYKRLIICLITSEAKTRQLKILEAACYSDSPHEFWTDQIAVAIQYQADLVNGIQQLSSDKIRHAVAMTIAQLFGAWMGELPDHESLPNILKGQQSTFDDHQPHFCSFWDFLRYIAPFFGVETVVEDLLEDDERQDLDMENDDTTLHSTDNTLAEAVRIRQDEKHNSTLNELRRLQFRQDAALARGPEGDTRFVINEAKEAGQGLIQIHPHISGKIREHQIEGVRFLWDEITKATLKGCLLAHTMGLGKTMQVITLLVALAEATFSDDETIASQVPEHLRDMKVVIICPAGLVNNWQEELDYWTPGQMLGPVHALVAGVPLHIRGSIVQKWAASAGPSILLCGYNLFTSLQPGWSSLLAERCSIVIADEAHRFKNDKSVLRNKVHEFKTLSRIALTGSPLSNNIDEYFSMIDWVSPGFLGSLKTFRGKWGIPIESGLDLSASRAANKKAKILLEGLKRVVGPKVHRRSMLVMKDALPEKKEYILYLHLTTLQLAAYRGYLQGDQRGRAPDQPLENSNVWALQAHMALLLAHPHLYYNHLVAPEVDSQPSTRNKSTHGKNEDGKFPLQLEVLTESVRVFRDFGDCSALELSHKMVVLDKILDEALNVGDKVLVFSQRIQILDFIETRILRPKRRRFFRIDGVRGTTYRQANAKKFNEDNTQVCLISTTAGGVGLNLQGASRVVIMDFKYNPQHENQAIGRAYRIGQTKPVTVYWLVNDGTMENTMQNSHIFKMQMASRVVDSKAPIAKSDKGLQKWFQEPREVEHSDTSTFRGKDSILDAILDLDGVASVVAAESYEEEELDGELQPHEIEQAKQMAEGKIMSVSVQDSQHAQVPQHPQQVGQPQPLTPLSLQPLPQQSQSLSQQSQSLSQQSQSLSQQSQSLSQQSQSLSQQSQSLSQQSQPLPLQSTQSHALASPEAQPQPEQTTDIVSVRPGPWDGGHGPSCPCVYCKCWGGHGSLCTCLYCELVQDAQPLLSFYLSVGKGALAPAFACLVNKLPNWIHEVSCSCPYCEKKYWNHSLSVEFLLQKAPVQKVHVVHLNPGWKALLGRYFTLLGLLAVDGIGHGDLMSFHDNETDSVANEKLQTAAEPWAPSGVTLRFDNTDTSAAIRSTAAPSVVPEPGISQPPLSVSGPSPMMASPVNLLTPDVGVATAKQDFELTLRKAFGPSKRNIVEGLVEKMEYAMDLKRFQGLQRRQAWNRLTKVVRTIPESADRMVGLATPGFVTMLVSEDKEQVVNTLKQVSTAQDPDQHTRRILQRSDTHDTGTPAAANDGALRQRGEQDMAVKNEKRQSKRPRVSDGDGSGSGSGSKHNPWVID